MGAGVSFPRRGSSPGTLPPATGSSRGGVRLNGDLDPNSTPDAPMLAPGVRSLILGALQAANPDFGGAAISDFIERVVHITGPTHTLTQDESGGLLVCEDPDGTTIVLPANLDEGSTYTIAQATSGPITLAANAAATLLEAHGYTVNSQLNSVFSLRVIRNANDAAAVYLAGGLTGIPGATDPGTGEPVPVPNSPGLLDQPTVRPFTGGVYGTRRLSASYTGPCCRVHRDSDGAQLEVPFLPDGTMDTAAVAAFGIGPAVTEDVYVDVVYDQSGQGRHWTNAGGAAAWAIFNGGDATIWRTSGSPDAQPMFWAYGEASGFVSPAFPAYTGKAVTAIVVGKMNQEPVTAGFSPRVISLYGASNTDSSDDAGIMLIARNGAGAGSSTMQTLRHGATRVISSFTDGGLNVWTAVQSATGWTEKTDGQGNSATGTVAALNATHIAMGYSGNAAISAPGFGWCEALVTFDERTDSELDIIRADQAIYYRSDLANAAPVDTLPADTSRFTPVYYADFAGDAWTPAHFLIYDNSKATGYKTNSWMARNVTVSGEKMRIRNWQNGDQREGGAVFLKGPSSVCISQGGAWEARWRVDGDSYGLGVVALIGWPNTTPLWPTKGEPDPVEITPTNRTKFGGVTYLHLDTVVDSHRQLFMPDGNTSPAALAAAKNYQVDWTQWHVTTFAWKPGQYIEIYIDGVLVARTTDTSFIPNVEPLRFGFQTEFYGTPENSFTGDKYVEIDWWRFSTIN